MGAATDQQPLACVLFLLWDLNLSGIGWEGNEAAQEPPGEFWTVSGMESVQFLNQAGTDRAGPTGGQQGGAVTGCSDCGQCWSGSWENEDLGAAEDASQILGKEGNFRIC